MQGRKQRLTDIDLRRVMAHDIESFPGENMYDLLGINIFFVKFSFRIDI